ncbi:hypothetical protein PROFUN_05447 [Planoprotostelium fungivorum]|uniref:Ketoreductase domain-containing protein n=1 Tax=Planoprotostelium fungivorum TaxID=1890364 RepID=A0A2P6NQR4_9EUKA|nr:hypothetical protein PROFUN_05447 [Planoprotostelium fungivorum]
MCTSSPIRRAKELKEYTLFTTTLAAGLQWHNGIGEFVMSSQYPLPHVEKGLLDFKNWTSIFENTNPDNSTRGLGVSIAISGGGFLLTLLVFCLLRDRWTKFFAPKYLDSKFDIPREKMRYIGWMWVTFAYPEKKLFLNNVGLDGIMYLRFLKYSMVFLLAVSVLGNTILTPINSLGPNKDLDKSDTRSVRGLDVYSIANIRDNDNVLYAHLISVFIFSLLLYNLSHRLFDAYIRLDTAQNRPEGVRQRSVLVTDIPYHSAYSSKRTRKYFAKMFGKESVHNTMVVPCLPQLSVLQNKRDKLVGLYKRFAHWSDVGDSSRGFTTIGGIFPFYFFPYPMRDPGHQKSLWGQRVRGMDYYDRMLTQIDERIRELQKREEVKKRYTNKAFVCFSTIGQALAAQQMLVSYSPFISRVYKAPHPKDICWEYLSAPDWQKYLRRVAVWVALAVIFVTWFIPIAVISAWIRIENLSKLEWLSGVMDFINTNQYLYEFASSTLPTLAYTFFMVILPYLLQYVLTYSGYGLYSSTERQLVKFYWLFLFLVSFLGYVFAAPAFVLFGDVASNPTLAATRLASAISKQAAYFTNYIVLQGWAGYAIFWLGRFDEFLLYGLKRLFYCVTEEEKKQAEAPAPFLYGILYTRQLFVLLIAVVYSTIAPYVVPFALSYFWVSWFSAKYNMIYVVMPRYQGGKVTLIVINRVGYALVIYQLVMIGVFLLKDFSAGLSIIGLVVLSIIYMIYNQKRFAKPFHFYPLDQTKPTNTGTSANRADTQRFTQLFHHPALTPPDEDHQFAVYMHRKRTYNNPHRRKTIRMTAPDLSYLNEEQGGVTVDQMERLRLVSHKSEIKDTDSDGSIDEADYIFEEQDSDEEVDTSLARYDDDENGTRMEYMSYVLLLEIRRSATTFSAAAYLSLFLDYVEIIVHQLIALIFFIQPAKATQKNKSAILITGASTGIGRHLVDLYAARGFSVIATVRRRQDAMSLSSSSDRVRAILVDVTDLKQCEEAVKSVQDILDREDLNLHALVNKAGVLSTGLSAFTTEETVRHTLEVNFFGPLRMVRLFFPLLHQSGGRIINTGSTASFFPAGLIGSYTASKGGHTALRSLTQSLQIECYVFGVKVSEVDPGLIRSHLLSVGGGLNLIQPETSIKVEKVTNAHRVNVADFMKTSAPPPWLLDVAYVHAVEGKYPLSFDHPTLDSKLQKLIFLSCFTDNARMCMMQKWGASPTHQS